MARVPSATVVPEPMPYGASVLAVHAMEKIAGTELLLNTEQLNQGVYICKIKEQNAPYSTSNSQVKRIIIRH